jgi:hypothetical protein
MVHEYITFVAECISIIFKNGNSLSENVIIDFGNLQTIENQIDTLGFKKRERGNYILAE